MLFFCCYIFISPRFHLVFLGVDEAVLVAELGGEGVDLLLKLLQA